MCGINGSVNISNSPVAAMNAATAHRGPDGSAVYTNRGATFGHNRLAVLEHSIAANQPMQSPDGRYTMVFNGEIYNFVELRKELASQYSFVTSGDTEVLLAAYTAWGEAALDKLRGMFAFAVYDAQQNEVFLARDQVGIKPLYYALEGNQLLFTSELSGLIAAGYKTLSREAVSLYLNMQYVPSPQTLLKGVLKLEPGETLRFSLGAGSVVRCVRKVAPFESFSVDRLYDHIGQTVTDQMVADREVGLFLSGGLDSSIVLHHAIKTNPTLKTFTLGFELEGESVENQERFNFDALTAERTAKHYGAKHTTFELSFKDVATNMELAFASLDEPVANPTSLTRFLLAKWVREQGVVVALGGDGGDEVFMGYPRYRAALAAEHFLKLPKIAQESIRAVYPRARKIPPTLDIAFHAGLVTNTGVVNTVLKEPFEAQTYLHTLLGHKYATYAPGLSGLDAYVVADRSTWLPDESLHATDRATMAHGLEYRVPLLDQQLIAAAAALPYRDGFSVREGKLQLRKVYRQHLPSHLFNQRKRGWLSPAAKWMRNGGVVEVLENILSDAYARNLSDLVDWSQVEQMFLKHRQRTGYFVNPLWNVAQLQVWARAKGLVLGDV